MSRSHMPLFPITILATAAWSAGQHVTMAGAVTGAAAHGLGIARDDCDINTPGIVDQQGLAICIAGGAFAVDAQLEVGAGGKLVTHNAGVVVARAFEAAAADGDRVQVLLLPN